MKLHTTSRAVKFFLISTLLLLIAAVYLTFGTTKRAEHMVWGVSFSKRAAEGLGLDWRSIYAAILDDLRVDHVRLGSYWDEIEPQPGALDFADLDWQIQQAEKKGVHVILTLGRRQPRWPECHVPHWAKELSDAEQKSALLEQVTEVVKRYRGSPAIEMWQVENEYFLSSFGVCPTPPVRQFLMDEIALVRSLDSRPVITTDSGEMSVWFRTAGLGDVFGTTMYRRAYNPILGVANWPQPPVYYSRLGRVVQLFTGFKKMIIVELQGEPWAKTTLQDDTTEVNYETLSPLQFRANIQYARDSGIDTAYLWGVEWWYYMKTERETSGFWDEAQKLWQVSPPGI